TLGVDVSIAGRHIRMPGDTLWGRQLDPLLEQKIITAKRYHFIQHSYDGADVIVADAGGGPIHPDPEEVQELVAHSNCCQLMVTHVPEFARKFLPTAEPGKMVTLIPREERTPEEAMSLFGSPILRNVPERWLLALLYGGDVVVPAEEPIHYGDGAVLVLAGALSVRNGGVEQFPLQRGDLFHPALASQLEQPELVSTAKWTRLLCIPDTLYQPFLKDTGIEKVLERLYHTRTWWRTLTKEELGLDTMVQLAHLCRERGFHPGAEIVRQGDRANHFYIVTSGQVEVVRKNGTSRTVGTFGAGFHFGEIALLGEEVRTATVRAVEPTQVLELPAAAFRRHLMEIPLARYRIVHDATARKAQLTKGP
ncbi:MAG TPA: cyclic nucleotide-binding domain-containing protein, partial [Armatimonadota bacterium]|nr:cyclic nucleotide-binding domain-containing protein [Armatimonadota bacterium]